MNRTGEKDLKGYAFIRNQIVHSGVTPSLREIGKIVGYASPRSVQLMLARLQKRGLLSYSNGVMKLSPRNTPAMGERTIDIPLVGSVACGLPSLAEQDPEALIPVSTKIAKQGWTYFLLRAKGNSMNKSGIKDGDLALVRQQVVANEGDRVVALINDDATIKHFHREKHVVVLKPNSTDKSHKPIILSAEFMIQGVVVGVLPDPF
jgi:repressor LexA